MAKATAQNTGGAFGPKTANDLYDMLQTHKQQKQLGAPGKRNPLLIDKNIIKVRNGTGGDLARGSVVDVGSYLLTGLNKYQPEHFDFGSITPAGGHYAVFRRAVEDGKIEEAQLTGVCIARVNVTDAGHRFAVPTDGQTYFTSATEGEIQILDAPTGDPGVRECIVVLRCGAGGEEPIRFELTEALALGDEAEAEQLLWNGSAYVKQGTTFTVRDFTARGWKGEVGYWGWCIKKTDRDTVEGQDEYDIIWMEMQARFVEFTLTEDMGETESEHASATVVTHRYWHTRQPEGTITVVDAAGLFTRALSGASGVAVYDERRDEYVIVECETKAGWIFGTLTEDMGESTSGEASATVSEFGGSQQDVQDPDPGDEGITVYDPQGLFARALNGAKFYAEYDAVADEYNLVECQTQAGWIRGTLTADMSSGSATVTVTDYGGSQQDVQDPGSGLSVYDPSSLLSRAKSGAAFYAVYDAVDDKYNLVECQTQAGWIKFTLTADMASGSAAATVNDYGGSQQDVQNPGSSLTVYDTGGNFPYAKSGAKGLAIYDAIDDQYRIVACEQLAIMCLGQAQGAFTSANSTATIDNLSVLIQTEFSQSPGSSVTADNTFGFDADDNAAVLIVRDGTTWKIIQAECPA